MRSMVYNLLFLFTGSVILAACAEQEIPEEARAEIELEIRTPSEAADCALGIFQQLSAGDDTRGDHPVSVESVEAVTVGDIADFTRSESVNTRGWSVSDTLVYVVNFADNRGSVIAGADLRIPPVLAIIPEQTLKASNISRPSTLGDSGFDVYMANMYLYVFNQISNLSLTDPTVSGGGTYRPPTLFTVDDWDVYEIQAPALVTNWSQHKPYNKYCNECRAGCVAIAAAQIITYFQSISFVPWTNQSYTSDIELNWDRIQEICRMNQGHLFNHDMPPTTSVALLIRYIGYCNKADYGSDSTSMDSGKVLEWLENKCNIKTSSLRKYNIDDIISALKRDDIVFGRGNAGRSSFWFLHTYNKGHAWVYDGYAKARKENKYYKFLHCNWGWNGDYNGYYLNDVFNTVNGPEFTWSDTRCDVHKDEGTERYYRFNLEYATVCRK